MNNFIETFCVKWSFVGSSGNPITIYNAAAVKKMCFPFQTLILNGTSRRLLFFSFFFFFPLFQQQNPLFQILFTRVSFIFLGSTFFFTASKMVLKIKAIFGVGNVDED